MKGWTDGVHVWYKSKAEGICWIDLWVSQLVWYEHLIKLHHVHYSYVAMVVHIFSPLPSLIRLSCDADAHTAPCFDVLEVAGFTSSTKTICQLPVISRSFPVFLFLLVFFFNFNIFTRTWQTPTLSLTGHDLKVDQI